MQVTSSDASSPLLRVYTDSHYCCIQRINWWLLHCDWGSNCLRIWILYSCRLFLDRSTADADFCK